MRISDWSSDVCSSDLVEVYPPLAGHQLGGHRLSGAGRPGKKCNEAPAEAHLAVELHLLKEGAPDLQPVANLFDLPPRAGRQDEVVEARLGPGFDPLSKACPGGAGAARAGAGAARPGDVARRGGFLRSVETRVGKECVGTCRDRLRP